MNFEGKTTTDNGGFKEKAVKSRAGVEVGRMKRRSGRQSEVGKESKK